jgi:hypothetical protein
MGIRRRDNDLRPKDRGGIEAQGCCVGTMPIDISLINWR